MTVYNAVRMIIMEGLKLKPAGKSRRDREVLDKLDEILEGQKKTNEYIKDLIMSNDDIPQVEKATTVKKNK